MTKTKLAIVSICALLLSHCAQKETKDDQRGGAMKSLNESSGSGDATAEGGSDQDKEQSAVITEGSALPTLKVTAEVDLSAMPPRFMEDISLISKVAPGKTLLYGKNGVSWLLDEGMAGALMPLQSNLSLPAGSQLYMQEDQQFWLYGASSIAFPSSKSSETLGQVALLNISPELLKDPQHKLLYVGPNLLILANETKANIVIRDGDKVRYLYLDLPKPNAQPLAYVAAGQGQGGDVFWFLTAEQLFLLSKTENGSWQWRASKFKVELPAEVLGGQVAMMVSGAEKDPSFLGRAFVLSGGKLFDREGLKLSLPDEKTVALQQSFTSQVKPLLTTYCVSCHPGYNEYPSALDKAAANKMHLMNKTMPPAQALSDADTKIILDWYASIPL
jgi:hypothetical protein